MDITTKITEVLNEKFGTEGYEDCFLVEIESLPGKRLNIFLDCDSGLSLKKCQSISRHVEAYIDEFVWVEQKYVLEVSSPGISKPLKILRQYINNIGREVKVKTDNGEEKGKLVAADEVGITILQKIVRKEGKKKIREKVENKIPFDLIKQTIVQISFNKKK